MNKIKLIQNWKIFLVLIVLVAAILRIYAISSVPVSMYWDEAAIGYNAYSIAHTAKDEYGNFLPLLFRSFDDYKLPGYIYLTAFFVKLFGLSEFSVRIGSALLGIITVFITFFLTKEILNLENVSNKRFSFINTHTTQIALWTAGLLAISPWHLQFSRTGFEANGSLFCIILGSYLLLRGLRNTTSLLVGSSILAMSFYFYRSAVVFVPLLFVLFVATFNKKLVIKKMYTVAMIGLFMLLSFPILLQLFSEHGQARFSQVTISQDVQTYMLQHAGEIQQKSNSPVTKFMYNRRVLIVKEIVTNYFSHFSPSFLIFSGDANGRHHVDGMGQIYFWEILFLLVGVYILLFLPRKIQLFLLGWLFISPLPAAITTPAPHALRSFQMLPIPQLLTSIGILYAYTQLPAKNKIVYTCSLLCVMLFAFAVYLNSYYILTPVKTANDWGDGYKQLTSYILPKSSSYQKIIVSGHYWQPYIYFLFYSHYDPIQFQKNGSATGFANYYFGGTSWDLDKGRKELDSENLYSISRKQKTLVALSPEEVVTQGKYVKHIHTVYNSFGRPMFLVGELK